MTKSSSLTFFALAALFSLSCGIASAEENRTEAPQVKPDVPTHPEESTSPKEETADKKPPESDTAKPKEEPNCE
ncbi:MAG: hypothetical protein Q8K12_12985 [Thiobacillus sp.]|nr:hypothetical protein [Thiobacillus sp.]